MSFGWDRSTPRNPHYGYGPGGGWRGVRGGGGGGEWLGAVDVEIEIWKNEVCVVACVRVGIMSVVGVGGAGDRRLLVAPLCSVFHAR